MFGWPRGEEKRIADEVGVNIHRQISKALKQNSLVFTSPEQMVFFKGYFDSFITSHVKKSKSSSSIAQDERLKKYICDGVLPKRLWEVYCRADGLIDLSSVAPFDIETLLEEAIAAATSDTYSGSENLYKYLANGEIDIPFGVPSQFNDLEISRETKTEDRNLTEDRTPPKPQYTPPSATPAPAVNQAETSVKKDDIQESQAADTSKKIDFIFLLIIVIAVSVLLVGVLLYSSHTEEIRSTNSSRPNKAAPIPGSLPSTSSNPREDFLKFQSELQKTLQDKISRENTNSRLQMKQVSVSLIFDDAGYPHQFSLRSGTQIDREFLKQLFSTIYFQRPPPNTKSVDLELLIPSRNASEPSTDDLDRGDTGVTNSSAPVSRPARPPLGYFQFLGDPVVRFTEAGHLDLTIKTNWTYEYAEPSIFLADEGAYSTNGVEYDPSLLNNLEIKFIDSQRSISIRSTVEVSRGKHWIILDIFTDRDSRYQRSIWFEAN